MLQNPTRLNREEWLPPQTHHIPVISNPDSRFLISKGSLYGEMEFAERRDSEAALPGTIRSSPPIPTRLHACFQLPGDPLFGTDMTKCMTWWLHETNPLNQVGLKAELFT